ncbi:MAG: hypothetical protein ACI4DP_03450, partial [Candidatus Ornithomonoglobus sp.]
IDYEYAAKVMSEKEGELTVTQYEELKALFTAQAAAIAELEATNTRLMNAVESTFVFNYNDDNVPAWAKDALTAAMQCGAVQGDENGELHLSYKDLRTIVREYRCGMYDMK